MVMIFEDNPKMSVSRLLLTSMFGSMIDFSEGNTKLYSKICEHQHEDFILIFMDVVPNNSSVMWEYNKLVRNLRDNFTERCGKSIFLVPLFCTEYIVLKYLNEILQIQQLTEFLKSYKLPVEIRGYGQLVDNAGKVLRKANSLRTFEAHCKAFLAYLTDDTLPVIYDKLVGARNLSIQDGQDVCFREPACFYICSCESCTDKCALASAGTVETKANMLYTSLPVFFSCQELRDYIGRQLQSASWEELHNFILQQYDNLYTAFCDWLSEKQGKPVQPEIWHSVQLIF